MERWRGRACELEQVVEDREEEVKIVERRSQGLVSWCSVYVCVCVCVCGGGEGGECMSEVC